MEVILISVEGLTELCAELQTTVCTASRRVRHPVGWHRFGSKFLMWGTGLHAVLLKMWFRLARNIAPACGGDSAFSVDLRGDDNALFVLAALKLPSSTRR